MRIRKALIIGLIHTKKIRRSFHQRKNSIKYKLMIKKVKMNT